MAKFRRLRVGSVASIIAKTCVFRSGRETGCPIDSPFKIVNIQGYAGLWEPIKTRKTVIRWFSNTNLGFACVVQMV